MCISQLTYTQLQFTLGQNHFVGFFCLLEQLGEFSRPERLKSTLFSLPFLPLSVEQSLGNTCEAVTRKPNTRLSLGLKSRHSNLKHFWKNSSKFVIKIHNILEKPVERTYPVSSQHCLQQQAPKCEYHHFVSQI